MQAWMGVQQTMQRRSFNTVASDEATVPSTGLASRDELIHHALLQQNLVDQGCHRCPQGRLLVDEACRCSLAMGAGRHHPSCRPCNVHNK